MTVKQAVKENKMISIILGVLATGLMAWAVWVTDASYAIHYGNHLVTSNEQISIQKSEYEIKSIADEISSLQARDIILADELKQQRDMIHNNHQEILKILLNIQKKMQ